ncbi:MAG: phosphomannomutase/phosphoglucomutase [Microgenomates group bacterium]|nr:phosphomannomutase/phosphoglucomutase [Microgenomates group bacterium]
MKNISINLTSFHDYDIRGIYPTEINEEFYYHLGKALALYIKKSPIAVGHDNRLSSPSLTKSLIKGITDSGVDVVFLGMISTEMHYFASGRYNFEANVIVSASHNPPEYNGAKIVKKGVIPIYSQYGFPEIKKLIVKPLPKAKKSGKISQKNIFSSWINHALSFIDLKKIKKLKIVVDAGNGMAGPSWMEMKKRLPVKIIPLYLEPDGNFPHHIADPLKNENLKDLISAVKTHHADLGIALDGDADRIFFIDETGTKLNGSVTTAILTDYFAKKYPGYYLYSAICSRVVPETIKKYHRTPLRTRVGHTFIKEAMKKTNGIFAGEHSGHYYFKKNYRADSSLIAGLTMLQILSLENVPLSVLRKRFEIYPSSGEINFKVKDRNQAVKAILKTFKNQANSVDDLDGYSFWFANWWFNARLSKTEPLLRINIEADNIKILEEQKKIILNFLYKIGAKKV